jgi:xanthosine utilization system XapX-like protein
VAFAAGLLVAFTGLMLKTPSVAVVVTGVIVALLGLVGIVRALRDATRLIDSAQAKAEAALREAIAEKKKDGNPPDQPL